MTQIREYDREKPLIAIHIPKSGGSTVKTIFQGWFKSRIYFHYYDEIKGKMPKKIRLRNPITRRYYKQLCILGHFNKNRKFGIKDYYPEVEQFVTIVRDPFEAAISNYFFVRSIGHEWKYKPRNVLNNDLKTYLQTCKPNFLNHFPFDPTFENYKELIEKHFIYIGITEDMEGSIKGMAKKLGFSAPTTIPWINVTKRSTKVPYEIKSEFMKRYSLEFAIYAYAKENYVMKEYRRL